VVVADFGEFLYIFHDRALFGMELVLGRWSL